MNRKKNITKDMQKTVYIKVHEHIIHIKHMNKITDGHLNKNVVKVNQHKKNNMGEKIGPSF